MIDEERQALVRKDLRQAVFMLHQNPTHPGALVQARSNRDCAWLAWCGGNFQPRYLGDDSRVLRPARGTLMPGVPHGCYDVSFVELTWPVEAITAGTEFWEFLDAEYELIVAEIGAATADKFTADLREQLSAVELEASSAVRDKYRDDLTLKIQSAATIVSKAKADVAARAAEKGP